MSTKSNETGEDAQKTQLEEFNEILERNKTVASAAILRSVEDASEGEFGNAIETLVTAVSLIRRSKIDSHPSCRELVTTLQDQLRVIENRAYGTISSKSDHSASRDHHTTPEAVPRSSRSRGRGSAGDRHRRSHSNRDSRGASTNSQKLRREYFNRKHTGPKQDNNAVAVPYLAVRKDIRKREYNSRVQGTNNHYEQRVCSPRKPTRSNPYRDYRGRSPDGKIHGVPTGDLRARIGVPRDDWHEDRSRHWEENRRNFDDYPRRAVDKSRSSVRHYTDNSDERGPPPSSLISVRQFLDSRSVSAAERPPSPLASVREFIDNRYPPASNVSRGDDRIQDLPARDYRESRNRSELRDREYRKRSRSWEYPRRSRSRELLPPQRYASRSRSRSKLVYDDYRGGNDSFTSRKGRERGWNERDKGMSRQRYCER